MKDLDTDFLNFTPRWKTIILAIIVSFLIPIISFNIIYPLLKESSVDISIYTLIISGLVLTGIALWAIRIERIPLEKLGISPGKGFKAVIMLAIGWAIVAIMLIPLILVEVENVRFFPNGPIDIIIMWLFVGIPEELMFRGYLLPTLLNRFKHLSKSRVIITAVLCSSILFSLLHIPMVLFNHFPGIYLIGDFLFGILMSYLFLRTQNILFCGLLHGNANGALVSFSITIGARELDVHGAVVLFIVLIVLIEVMIRSNKPGSLRRYILPNSIP